MKKLIPLLVLILSCSAFAQTNPRYNLNCQVGLSDEPLTNWVFIDNSHESSEIDLGYGIIIHIIRVDDSRFAIQVQENGKFSYPPKILDATKTTFIAMLSGGAAMQCRTQLVQKN